MAFGVAAVLSVALHVGALLAFVQWREAADFGANAAASEAVSVEIVESKVLEAMLRKDSTEPAPSIDATAPQEGSVEASAAHREKPVEEPHKQDVVAPIAAPVAPDEETRVIQQQAPKPTEEERERERQAKADTHAGGPTSQASEGKGTGVTHVSASPGRLLEYAAHVQAQARVARNKPAGRGFHGTAVVAFAITPSGSLAYASMARSSGKPGIDQAALSAVLSAAPPFPPPPTGATPTQLQFSISFRFE